MAGLLKHLNPRATRESDAAIVSRASKARKVPTAVRGGKGIYEKIATISALVNTKLSKYVDEYALLRDEVSVREYFDVVMKNGIAAIDTETDSLDPILCNIAGVCLYSPGQKPAYIPLNHVSYVTGVKSSNQVELSVVRDCLEKCEQSKVKWILHTYKFDRRVTKHQVGVKISCFWDVYLAARCLNENEPENGLKELHLKYCKSTDTEAFTYDKLFQGVPFTQIPISIAYLYAAGDALKTFQVYEFQKQYLTRSKLPGCYNVFMNLEMPLVPVVAEMEDTGILLDVEYARKLSEKYTAILKEKEDKFFSILSMYSKEIQAYRDKNPGNPLSEPININSPPQISVVLYDILKIKPPDPKKPRGTGEEIIELMKIPLTDAILEYRGIAKLLSTYIDKLPKMINPKTKRIHCQFNQYGADTGRFSSQDPNMQNIPAKNKEIRQMFVAGEGNVLIACDFSQQEPRTLAHMSKDEHLIKAYSDGKDIYSWIASSIYAVPYDECKEYRSDGTKNPEGHKRRNSVKSIILGIMYGRGAKAIGEQLNCSTKEAQKIIDKFFSTYPKVRDWMDKTVEGAYKNGFVETAWGRKRRLPDLALEPYEFKLEDGRVSGFDPLDFDSVSEISTEVDEVTRRNYIKKLDKTWSFADKRDIIAEARKQGIIIKDNRGFIADAERQCVNSVIQGSSADMTKKAMIMLGNDKFLADRNCKLLLQVHDEIIAEAPIECAKECAARISSLMVEAATEKISVPMKCDAEITKVWYGKEVDFDE